MPRVNEEYFVAEAAAEEVYVCASPGEYFGVVPIPTVIFWLFLLLAAFAILQYTKSSHGCPRIPCGRSTSQSFCIRCQHRMEHISRHLER